ncbi:MAG: hypothetical protein ACR2PT_01540 [Endozoicomonas sp.]
MAELLKPTVLAQDMAREELQEAFDRDGYLLLEGFYSARECLQLKERMCELINPHDISEHRAVFSALGACRT